MRGLILLLGVTLVQAQPPAGGLDVREYEPRPSLVVPQNPRTRAKFPFIDVHNHPRFPMPPEQAKKLVAGMDALNLRIVGSLFVRGGNGEPLRRAVKSAAQMAPGLSFVLYESRLLEHRRSGLRQARGGAVRAGGKAGGARLEGVEGPGTDAARRAGAPHPN